MRWIVGWQVSRTCLSASSATPAALQAESPNAPVWDRLGYPSWTAWLEAVQDELRRLC